MKRMLMVNDDMVGMENLPQMYLHFGIDLVIVGSFEEALKNVKECKFDFIMTDVALNGPRTGIDLVREVRKIDQNVKVAVATGYGYEYRLQAKVAGANLYFLKPLDFEEHILNPLGITHKSLDKNKDNAVAVAQEMTLRRAVHDIANSNNLVIMVSGLLKEVAEGFIKEKKTAEDVEEFLQRVADDAGDIETAAKTADSLLKKVRESVYNKLNADEVTVE